MVFREFILTVTPNDVSNREIVVLLNKIAAILTCEEGFYIIKAFVGINCSAMADKPDSSERPWMDFRKSRGSTL